MSDGKIRNGYTKEEAEAVEKQSRFVLSESEYLEIANKIIAGDDRGYEMLFERAEKNLRGYVRWKCHSMDIGSLEDDVMQDFKLKLFTSVVLKYFKRDGMELNPDYIGFSAWMKKVALNVILDNLRWNNKLNSKTVTSIEDLDGDGESGILDNLPSDEDSLEDRFIKIEAIAECMDTVICSGNSVYKIIAWLGHRILVYKRGLEDLDANRTLTELAEQKTLYDMYDAILGESDSIKWLCLSEAHKEKIEKELAKVVDGRVMGDRLFSEFYMSKGPESTISDWRNRIEEMLKKKCPDKCEDL